MRGDSIRDLYAKTLALLGLGLLAGTGALVDYWPSTPSVLPVVIPALVTPESGWRLPSPTPVLPVVPPTVHASAIDAAPAAAVTLPVLSVSEPSDLFVGETVALAEPPPAPLPLTVVAALAGEEVSFRAPGQEQGEEWETPIAVVALNAAPVSGASDEESDGLIAGASRRIGAFGASIVRGGAKTGASVVDMVRVVNRTIRRVLPD